MALTAGNVTVTSARPGERSGSGLALALYDAWNTPYWDTVAANNGGSVPEDMMPGLTTYARGKAAEYTAMAAALVAYLVANTVVSGGGIS